MRSAYVIGNWKMNGSAALAESLAQAAIAAAAESSARVALCPPFTLLSPMGGLLAGSRVALGGQDCHAASQGAFTGDVSAGLLKEAGCEYVIVGHSERRAQHGESNDAVRAKALAALAVGLMPVICVGETLEQRQAGEAEAVVARQIEESVPKNAADAHFLLAYEPVWAIGSGLAATADDIIAMHARIAALKPKAAVLYGGSVKADNAAEILALPGVSGVLVGGASLDAQAFRAIIAAAE